MLLILQFTYSLESKDKIKVLQLTPSFRLQLRTRAEPVEGYSCSSLAHSLLNQRILPQKIQALGRPQRWRSTGGITYNGPVKLPQAEEEGRSHERVGRIGIGENREGQVTVLQRGPILHERLYSKYSPAASESKDRWWDFSAQFGRYQL